MSNPFDYVTAASYSKKNLMRGSENDEMAEKDYNPWMANMAFSYHPDTILHANLMNQYYFLDHRPQFEFYINSLRPKKRFAKWVKNASDDDLNVVCDYYQCNRILGREYLSLLTSEQLEIMKQEQKTGGLENGRSKKSS